LRIAEAAKAKKIAKDIGKSNRPRNRERHRAAHTGMTKAVIGGALIFVGKHRVGLR